MKKMKKLLSCFLALSVAMTMTAGNLTSFADDTDPAPAADTSAETPAEAPDEPAPEDTDEDVPEPAETDEDVPEPAETDEDAPAPEDTDEDAAQDSDSAADTAGEGSGYFYINIDGQMYPVGGGDDIIGEKIPEDEEERISSEQDDSVFVCEDDYALPGGYTYSSTYLYDNELKNATERSFYNRMDDACRAVLSSTKDYTEKANYTSGARPVIAYVPYSGISDDRAASIFRLFRYSNPQYYFLANSYGWGSSGFIIEFFDVFGYSFQKYSVRKNADAKLSELTNEWMPEFMEYASDLDRELAISTKIIEYLTYDDPAVDDSNPKHEANTRFDQSLISGVLRTLTYKVSGQTRTAHTTICAGYAMITAYFLNAAGIESFYISGPGHAWNMVKLYDNWYELDNTWADNDKNYTVTIKENWRNKSHNTFKSQDPSYHVYKDIWDGINIPSTTRDTVLIKDLDINASNFPDPVFRNYVAQFDTDGAEGLSSAELAAVTAMDISGKGITNLKGIEKFKNLEVLDCSNNDLGTLNLGRNKALTELDCSGCGLTNLDVSNNTKLWYLKCTSLLSTVDPNGVAHQTDSYLESIDVSKNTALEWLMLSGNRLTKLDVSKCTKLSLLKCDVNYIKTLDVSKNTLLSTLSCYANQLTAINVGNLKKLESLHCESNKISSLNVAQNSALQTLVCGNNPISTLNVSSNAKLSYLDIDNTKIKSIDVSKNPLLSTFSCSYNGFTSIDVSKNYELYDLDCSGNQLTKLVLTNNTGLVNLNCSRNKLTAIDVRINTELGYFNCDDNMLTSLDVSSNPEIYTLFCDNNMLTSLDVSKNQKLENLYCDGNKLAFVDVSGNTLIDSFSAADNKYRIGRVDDSYALANIPGFDPTKASNWSGADYDSTTQSIKNIEGTEVTYTYDCGQGCSAVFTFVTSEVTKIAVGKAPTGTFYQGKPLPLTDCTIKVTYDDGFIDTIPMTGDMIPDFDSTTPGQQTVTVTFGGKTTTFRVNITALAATKLEIKDQPTEIFDLGTAFSVGNGTLLVTYNSGDTDTIPMTAGGVTVDSSKFNNQKAGTYVITVKYLGKQVTYPVEVYVSETSASAVLTRTGTVSETKYYATLAEAFDKITSNKDSESAYTITVKKNVTEKALTFPKTAASITLVTTGGAVICTSAANITVNCNAVLDADVIHIDGKGVSDGKKIPVKAAANTQLTVSRVFRDMGAISGTNTSDLIFSLSNEGTVDSISTFNTVETERNVFVNGKISGIGCLNGTFTLNDAVNSSATITAAGSAGIKLRQGKDKNGNTIIPKLTVSVIKDALVVYVVGADGKTAALPTGTPIMTAGKTDIDLKKLSIGSKTPSGETLDPFLYTKEIRAEYKNALVLNGVPYPNFELAFKNVIQNGKNAIILNTDISADKFALPTKLAGLDIRSGSDTVRTITLNKTTSITAAYDLSFSGINIVSAGAKTFKIGGSNVSLANFASTPAADVTVGADGNLSLANIRNPLGNLIGQKNSSLSADNAQAENVSGFAAVVVGEGKIFKVNTKVSGIGTLTGKLLMMRSDSAASLTVTKAENATLYLTYANDVVAKATVSEAIGTLTIEAVNADGTKAALKSGTTVLTLGGNESLFNSLSLTNKDDAGNELALILNKKDVYVQYARSVTVSDGTATGYYPSIEKAFDAINKDTKAATKDYTVTLNVGVSADKPALPARANSLTIKSADSTAIKTVRMNGVSSLTAKYPLILENIGIENNGAKGPSSFTISASVGNVTIKGLVSSTLSGITGGSRYSLIIGKSTPIDKISGFGGVNVIDDLTVGKMFSTTDLSIGKSRTLTIPKDCAVTAKNITGGTGSSIKLMPGFKPITISGDVYGTIALVSDAPIADNIQILNSKTCSFDPFDVSGIKGGAEGYGLTREQSKVFCKFACFEFNGAKYVKWSDILSVIDSKKDKNGNYSITLLGNCDMGGAFKLPNAGNYNTLTVRAENRYKISFTGDIKLTGNTVFSNVDLSSMKNGSAVKYKIDGAKKSLLSISSADLGSVASLGGGATNVTLSDVTFNSDVPVKINADTLIYSGINGIIDTLVVNTLKAGSSGTLCLLEGKTGNVIYTGIDETSSLVTLKIVTADGSFAQLKNNTVLFSRFMGSDINIAISNPGVSIKVYGTKIITEV